MEIMSLVLPDYQKQINKTMQESVTFSIAGDLNRLDKVSEYLIKGKKFI